MLVRARGGLMAGAGLVVALAACGLAGSAGATGAATRAVAPCRGRDVTASFRLVPGSRGAGNVLYALRLRDASTRSCWVSGLAGLRLVGRTGRLLPTHVQAADRGALTAVRVVLAPGGWATATARFSPDVPGPGEGHPGQCEPIAYRIRVSPPPGGGIAVGPVSPPTAVCSHGALSLTALVAGRTPPGPS